MKYDAEETKKKGCQRNIINSESRVSGTFLKLETVFSFDL